MGQVTKITPQKRRGRYNVFIDGKYSFPASEDTIIKFSLFKDRVLSDTEAEAIKAADESARAFAAGVDYISHQSRTCSQVNKHLIDKGFTEDDAAEAVDRLVELRYLDDEDYARRFIEENQRMGQRGPRAISAWLRGRGIDDNMIQDALVVLTAEDETEVATRVAERYVRANVRKSQEAVRRGLFQNLMQKGFGSEIIGVVVEEAMPELDAEHENDLLRKQAEKVWFQKRALPERERRMKAKQALFRKGFSSDDIEKILTILSEEEDLS